MKRLSQILIALIVLSTIAVQLVGSEVTIGIGNQQARLPLDLWYRNSLYECIYFQNELNIISGNIHGLAFYNNFVSTTADSLPTKIWLGTTTLSDLSGGWIPSTSLSLVYDGNVTYPTGQNTIYIGLDTPYTYSGDNLVMMIQRPTDTRTYNYNDNFLTQTIGSTRARVVYSDGTSYDPAAPPTGTATTGRFPKTTFYFTGQSAIQNDLTCQTVTGSINPGIGSNSEYMVTIKNNGQTTQNNYSVRLMQEGGILLGNIVGNPIIDAEVQTYTFTWIPASMGPTRIYGRVVLNGDVNTDNNQSPYLAINVQPAGTQSHTIGIGNQQARLPINMYYKSSLFETIYLASELEVNGLITGIQLYNNFSTNLPNKPTNIWMGETTQENLAGGWIPSSQLTQVFSGNADYLSGVNNVFISFSTPLVYGGGNLVLLMERPLDSQYYDSENFFYCQTIGTSRSLMVQSRTEQFNPASPPLGTVPIGQFPKATFLYNNQIITNDLSCVSLTGNTILNTGIEYEFVTNIRNNGLGSQTDYQVKLMLEGDIEISSITGNVISFSESQSYTFHYIPTQVGTYNLYCKVVLSGDELPDNNQCPDFPVTIWEAGTETVTIGSGTMIDRLPVDFMWLNSLYECLYYQNELNISSGAISGLVFYNDFSSVFTDPKPTKIWLGNTTQSDLSGGWIPSTGMTLVFDGEIDYPFGQNNIEVALNLPFTYYGETLVMMVQRPWDIAWYSNSDNFLCQREGNVRARRAVSDDVVFDPAAPPTDATLTGFFPKTTFYVIEAETGSLGGTILASGVPLAGVSISVQNTNLSTLTDTNGHYHFPHVTQGTHTISVFAHGYTPSNINVTILPNQSNSLDLNMSLLPQVAVSGRVVGSDAPTIGIAGALVIISGYEYYSSTSLVDGYFSINPVFSGQTYQISIQALGYQLYTGQVVVNESDLNVGDLVLRETANSPSNVVALENTAFTQVDLTWGVPAVIENVSEGFEGTLFPPNLWIQSITNNGSTGTTGVLPTWCQLGNVVLTPPATPHGGANQAGLRWDINHQDEWLKTPLFVCPESANLTFWSYVFLGSMHGDHYYVKISVDGGFTWTPLWDASAQTGGWNYFTSPISIDLSLYAGLQVTIAWHAVDSPRNEGLWYSWFIDDIIVSGPEAIMSFPVAVLSSQNNHGGIIAPSVYPGASYHAARSDIDRDSGSTGNIVSPSTASRSLLGHQIWRLVSGDQDLPDNWVLLTPEPIMALSYSDISWEPLPAGVYKYAVKSVFSNNVLSGAAFSNEVYKGMSGTLAGSVHEMGTNLPVAGARVTAGRYNGVTDDNGMFSFGVFQGIYTITVTKNGYQPAFSVEVIITASETALQNFVLEELNLPAGAVQAAVDGSDVSVNWMAPGTVGGEWIHYDSGVNTNSIGTGGPASFDVAVRYPASELAQFAGQHLYALNVWPTQGGTFSIKVWTGGTASAPGTLVVNQAFTPNLASYTTVNLDNPVMISGTDELWFGYNCNVSEGFPAGCDAGPQDEGFGNMICFNGSWSTLSSMNADLSYNWNIQGFVGYSVPQRSETIVLQSNGYSKTSKGTDRAHIGYKMWRLIAGQEEDEASWALLTPSTITATAAQDAEWGELPEGSYRWAVKAVYSNDVLSVASFSNSIVYTIETGMISGVVRQQNNQPIPGAVITAGDYAATTNNSGAYSIVAETGTYSVHVSANNYQGQTVENVLVVANQTTTVNFVLIPGSSSDDPSAPVVKTELVGNYPNPFNPSTTISYALKDPSNVELVIYNLKGQKVKTLLRENQGSGRYQVIWDGKDEGDRPVGSGVYYYVMKAGAYQSMRKMLLVE